MAAKLKNNTPDSPRRPPGTTPDVRENQLIAAAVDLAERQILDGTATSQVISHFLKLGSSRERLEQQRLEKENELLRAKADQLASQKGSEEMYEKALRAMRSYTGQEELDEEQD